MDRVNGLVWMENEGGENGDAPPWPPQSTAVMVDVNVTGQMDSSLSNFRSMMGVDVDEGSWFNEARGEQQLTFQTNAAVSAAAETQNNLMLNPVDSSASCSPSPASMFTNLDPSQVTYFLPNSNNKQSFQSVLNDVVSDQNPLENGFDFLEPQLFNDFTSNNNSNNQIGILPNLTSNSHLLPSLPENRTAFTGYAFRGFDGTNSNTNRCSSDSVFLNRPMTLKPLENFESIAAQPTLFQKRAALRKSNASDGLMMMNSGGGGGISSIGGNTNNTTNLDDISIDGSGMNYDSDDFLGGGGGGDGEGSSKNGNNNSTGNSGKKKGLPAKNLMAERRRRKKLNDRLYMLRSVVPKISKMDRASILGDAIEYLKELLQKINQLHNELESTNPPGASTSFAPNNNMMTSFYPLTPTPPLTNRIKDELYPASASGSMNTTSPNSQPRKIEVRAREGRAVNIHMFCGRKPGLLLSTMRAMDEMGLDIQQAVISCFNGFAMDIFRAEQCREGQDLSPEQIKTVLLESAGL